MPDRVVIITGAGRGIGRATAVELAKRGCRLVLVSRNEIELRETAAMSDRDALVVTADVADVRSIRGVAAQALAKFGRIDGIVNNAGNAPVLSIEDTTIEQWRSVIDTNLTAPFLLCQAAWPTFRKQNSGVIVNLSSNAARDPFTGFLAYGAAKAGLNTLSLSLAREGAAIGVRVHVVAPSKTETAMLRAFLPKEQAPTETIMQPADVARVIADCITGELAHTSGEVIWLKKAP